MKYVIAFIIAIFCFIITLIPAVLLYFWDFKKSSFDKGRYWLDEKTNFVNWFDKTFLS